MDWAAPNGLLPLAWDPSFLLENTKSPRPENPGKLLKKHNLAHPGPVLKITENFLKVYIFFQKNKKTKFFD